MLKAELHIHINRDPIDTFIKYTVYDVIKKAQEKKFDIIAITMHNKLFSDPQTITFAKKRGILLIPGIEKTIEGKDTLILNPPESIEKIHTIKELQLCKEQAEKDNHEMLIIAPHPFFITKECHKDNIMKHFDLFDAWEFSYFYTNTLNLNKKLYKLEPKKPIIGTSDVHMLRNFGRTYTCINAEKNISSVFQAIKNNNIHTVTRPLSNWEFITTTTKMLLKIPQK